MKRNIVLISVLVVCTILQAQPRSQEEGMQIAKDFLSKAQYHDSDKQKSKSVDNPIQLIYSKKTKFQKDAYFVYGRHETPGFVIVSADERAYDVLGYSHESFFDQDNMPDNMRAWLSFYEKEMDNLSATTSTTKKTIPFKSKQAKNVQYASSISPLLGGIKWNQSAPYNNLCPILSGTTRTATGCVATAMAQVMKYHEWPTQGTGSHSYKTKTKKYNLSANFGATTYDWANMTNTYHSGSTAVEENAVATLMYHCGVAVDMDYDDSSGAYSHDIGQAMIDYFGYDSKIQLWTRDFYTRTEWINLIKTELNANRPVIYAGVSQDGGHQFVCDGYDSNDYFHINWGWGGMSDGYFRISTLDPDNHGIGGGVGGFNTDQSLLTGVQKPTAGTSLVSQFYMTDTIKYPEGVLSRSTTVKITAQEVYNYGSNTIKNLNYKMLFLQNGVVKYTYGGVQIASLAPLYGRTQIDFTLSSTTFNSIANGSYQVAMGYKTDDDLDWVISRYYVGNPYYINMDLTDTTVEFWSPTNQGPSLELISLSTEGNLYTNKSGRFHVKLKNNGREHNSELAILLESTMDPDDYQFYAINQFNIAEGELFDEVLVDSIDLSPGNYEMYLMRAEYNIPEEQNYFYYLHSTGVPVTVYATPTGSSNLSVTSKISFPDNTAVDKDNAVLTATIKNTGVIYDEDIIAFIFNANGTGNSLTYIGYQPLIIDENESQTVQFKGSIDLPDDEYLIALFYYDNGWEQLGPSSNSILSFNLITVVSSVYNPSDYSSNSLQLGPVPTENYLNIYSSSEILSAEVYSMTGQRMISKKFDYLKDTQIDVSTLNSGIYLLKVNTHEGMKIKGFVKE